MSATIERETGMLDVGTHCAFCRQIDFLPFHCALCNGDFCSSHRSKEAHHCKSLIDSERKKTASNVVVGSKDNNGKFFQSLLPEKGYLRVQQKGEEAKVKERKPVSIRSTANKSALDRLAKFFKRKEVSKTALAKRSKPTGSNKLIQLAKLKKSAEGDAKIPISNRVYVYCYLIDDDQVDSKEHEIFMNKVWPIGRALDYVAQRLNVSNHNNDIKATPGDKLYLYKKDDPSGEYLCLEPSGRVATDIKDLDTIYLIRGDDKV